MKTQVAIIGAGPAGLILSHLLHLQGIESVILEARSRSYIEQRVRAGVLEQGTRDLLIDVGLGERMVRQGVIHKGTEIRFGSRLHRIDFADLTGKAVTVYGQQEVVKDVIDARLASGVQIIFEANDVTVEGIDSDSPVVRFSKDGVDETLHCDFVAGCDGFHGICRSLIPEDIRTEYQRVYPFAWVSILAEAPPVSEEIVYSHQENGFALYSMRSPTLSRHNVQCNANEDVSEWPDQRIWDELRARLGPGREGDLVEGPILDKLITVMRSFVVEPMHYGRLFLAGDSAHIVPPTGAKGMNLAIADVRTLSAAFVKYYRTGKTDQLERYSDICLDRVWKVQRFSSWMTSMLHQYPDPTGVTEKLQLAELDYISKSRAAATALAENYVGLPYVSLD